MDLTRPGKWKGIRGPELIEALGKIPSRGPAPPGARLWRRTHTHCSLSAAFLGIESAGLPEVIVVQNGAKKKESRQAGQML